MGPKNEPFKRRWFTLDRRKLMYFEEPLVSFLAIPFFLDLHENHVCSCTVIFQLTGTTFPHLVWCQCLAVVVCRALYVKMQPAFRFEEWWLFWTSVSISDCHKNCIHWQTDAWYFAGSWRRKDPWNGIWNNPVTWSCQHLAAFTWMWNMTKKKLLWTLIKSRIKSTLVSKYEQYKMSAALIGTSSCYEVLLDMKNT